ncbi:hypothetical protein [Brevibacterium sp. RIT 803]|uniref:hypothetical protein n=1 Tax=Brevibacterium sp. RIT 803 TaxID=2810210 RepID=UPI00195263A8|nr:hypothetical protein [Brevibacterium sp. RIT 803]MBM6588919.1 hypothetical protein [Brevibacterium sp. RIT 803]
MSTPRWEGERSAWLKARAGHRLGVRRRAEQLALVARRQERLEAGVGDSAFGEVTTRNVFYRSVHREEGAANLAGWMIWTLIWMSATYVLVGPALLIGLGAYGIWWRKVEEWGRMRSVPYFKAAGAVAAIGVAILTAHSLLATEGVTRILIGSWQTWPLEGGAAFLTGYLWLQLVLGLVRAGWRVRAWGWPAVARVERAGATAVQAVELEGFDHAELEEAPHSDAPAIAPIEISVDDEELEDWMVEEQDEPVYADENDNAQKTTQ